MSAMPQPATELWEPVQDEGPATQAGNEITADRPQVEFFSGPTLPETIFLAVLALFGLIAAAIYRTVASHSED